MHTLPAAPSFDVRALLARVQSVRIAAPVAMVQPADKTPRFVSQERNPRSVASIIEESDDLECFDVLPSDNEGMLTPID